MENKDDFWIWLFGYRTSWFWQGKSTSVLTVMLFSPPFATLCKSMAIQ